MYWKSWIPVALLLLAGGCGQANQGTSGISQNGQAGSDTPDKAVFTFLEAVRTGNDQVTAAMLTPAARQKTEEMQMAVAPKGSPTAKFRVGQVEYVTPNKDGAHVWSNWTDQIDADGHTRTDDIIWVLRREADGWRIAGMVTKVYADQPPLVLNFEDPEDMQQKQQLLHQAEGVADPGGPSTEQPQANRPEVTTPVAR